MAVCQNLVPLVNIKIAGKWMFIPLKMVLIGIDPYPNVLGMSRFRDDTIDSTPLIFQFLQLPAFYISYFHVKNNRGKPSKFSELLEMAIEMVKNYFSPPPKSALGDVRGLEWSVWCQKNKNSEISSEISETSPHKKQCLHW